MNDFNLLKTLQICLLLLDADKYMDLSALYRRIYMLDRAFILSRGFSITGDTIKMTSDGIKLVILDNLLTGSDSQSNLFLHYILVEEKAGMQMASLRPKVETPEILMLSRREERVVTTCRNESYTEEDIRELKEFQDLPATDCVVDVQTIIKKNGHNWLLAEYAEHRFIVDEQAILLGGIRG